MSDGSGPGWEQINSPATTITLDCSSACVHDSSTASPIDALIEEVRSTLVLGQPKALAENGTLGRLLILSLVTSVEGYFREILFGLTTVCPIAHDKVADTSIPLGALTFYGSNEAARGMFERVSFASAGEIKTQAKSIAGLAWKDADSLGVALGNFEKVCHMRHAAVHSKGILSRGNAKALGVANSGGKLQLAIGNGHLQDAALTCLILVREFNQELYRRTLLRWRDQQILTGLWRDDKQRFERFYYLFLSRTDGVAPPKANAAYRSFQSSLVSRNKA